MQMTSKWRTKSVEQSILDTDEPGTRLRKNLTWWDLTVFGISVVIGGAFYVRAANFSPFVPASETGKGSSGTGVNQSVFSLLTGAESSHYGWYGMLAGASIVFFAFIGFDVVATTAEETKNPQRDV